MDIVAFYSCKVLYLDDDVFPCLMIDRSCFWSIERLSTLYGYFDDIYIYMNTDMYIYIIVKTADFIVTDELSSTETLTLSSFVCPGYHFILVFKLDFWVISQTITLIPLVECE